MADGAPTSIFVGVETGAQSVSLGDAVVRLEIEDHDRLVDEARVTLADSFDLAGAHLANGHAITIWLGWEGERVKMFTGTVVQIGGEVGAGATSGGTTIVAHDLSARMQAANNNFAAEPGEKLSDLVTRIASRHRGTIHMGEIECQPDPTFERANLPRQLARSDYEFLQDLARTWGARCFVEINDDQPKFYFKSIQSLWAADPLGQLDLCRGRGAITSFRYERIAARATRQLVTAAIDPVSGATVRGDSGPTTPPAPAAGRLSSSVTEIEPGLARANDTLATATASAVAEPPPPATIRGRSSDPARARSYVVVDPTQALGLKGEVRAVGHVELRAKGRVTLIGMAPWAEGDWWIKRVTHTFTPARPTATPPRPTATYECQLEVTR